MGERVRFGLKYVATLVAVVVFIGVFSWVVVGLLYGLIWIFGKAVGF